LGLFAFCLKKFDFAQSIWQSGSNKPSGFIQKGKKMFFVTINEVLVAFVMFQDKNFKAEELLKLATASQSVYFVDTPPTQNLLETLKTLKLQEKILAVFDHHGISEAKTEGEKEILAIQKQIEVLHGGIHTTREKAPGCAQLFEAGIAKKGDLVVADPDPDGLISALKLCGVTYEGLEQDCAILDGPRSEIKEENLSEYARIFRLSLSALPDFSSPEYQNKKKLLFMNFVLWVETKEQNNPNYTVYKNFLEAKAKEHQEQVTEALRLLNESTINYASKNDRVILSETNTTSTQKKFDIETIAKAHEIGFFSVLIKKSGPIASIHGEQFTIVRTKKAEKAGINLLSIFDGFQKTIEAGLIANTPFIVHCSKEIYWSIQDKLITIAENINEQKEKQNKSN
jgi:hypothetical protein